MLFAAGLVLLALGIFSGAVLLLAPLGVLEATASLTLWILFPVFTVAGYFLAAAPAENRSIPTLSRISGGSLLLLALAAGVALVLQASAIIEPRAGTGSLWYVLVLGLLLGGSGLAAHKTMAKT